VSFTLQGYYRFRPRRPSRRKVAGEESHRRQQRCHTGVCQRIGRRHAEELARDKTAERDRGSSWVRTLPACWVSSSGPLIEARHAGSVRTQALFIVLVRFGASDQIKHDSGRCSLPICRFFTQPGIDRVVFDINNCISVMLFVANVSVEWLSLPELSRSFQYLVTPGRGEALPGVDYLAHLESGLRREQRVHVIGHQCKA
jgi:hypothetical protein